MPWVINIKYVKASVRNKDEKKIAISVFVIITSKTIKLYIYAFLCFTLILTIRNSMMNWNQKLQGITQWNEVRLVWKPDPKWACLIK